MGKAVFRYVLKGSAGPLRIVGVAALVALAGLPAAAELPQASIVSAPAAPTEISSEEREGLIFERQQIMQKLDEDAALLGDIVAGLAPATKLAETTRSLAKGAREARNSFRQVLPGGRSKPEVWSNAEDYARHMDAFVRNAEALAKIGETGNTVAVVNMLGDALPCKECHDIYREPRKKPQS